MKKIIIVCALCVALLSTIFVINKVNKAKSDGVIIVEVIDKNDNLIKSKNIEFKEGDILLDLVKNNFSGVQTQSFSYGEIILSIEGITTDFNTSYFSILVNGEASMVGISQIELKDGIKISLVEVIFG